MAGPIRDLLNRLLGRREIVIKNPPKERVHARYARLKSRQATESLHNLADSWDRRNPIEREMLGGSRDRA